MQYAFLIYESQRAFEQRNEPDDPLWTAWRTYNDALKAAGVYLGGEPLKPDTSATMVRVRDGERQVQDGPYADTKEQLGGFFLVELPSLDEALAWAARCPAAAYGAVEVRPVADMRSIFAAKST